VPAPLVAKLMGHVDASMLTRVYGHPMADSVDTTAIFGAMAR
jgi:integrase